MTENIFDQFEDSVSRWVGHVIWDTEDNSVYDVALLLVEVAQGLITHEEFREQCLPLLPETFKLSSEVL